MKVLQGKISEFDVQEFNNSPEYKEAFEQLKFVFEKIGWIDTSSSSSSTNRVGNKYKSIKEKQKEEEINQIKKLEEKDNCVSKHYNKIYIIIIWKTNNSSSRSRCRCGGYITSIRWVFGLQLK